VLVVIVVLVVLAAIILPALVSRGERDQGIYCPSNLQWVGLAYRTWADENGGKFPFELSVTNGGTMELNNGSNAWLNFLVMSNELSTPKVLLCQVDTKHLPTAANFSSQLAGHVSYFVGLDAKKVDPLSILSGDDNFEIGGVPVQSGLLNLASNTPLAWSAARHHFAGNILFADGSVQSLSNAGLANLLRQTGLATNRLAIP
jgi:prepilin-type processing-associated H-X9-DG protein